MVRPERFENDEIGLADWVDEQILNEEQRQTAPRRDSRPPSPPRGNSEPPSDESRENTPSDGGITAGPFKLSVGPKSANRGRGVVNAIPKADVQSQPSSGEIERKKPGNK